MPLSAPNKTSGLRPEPAQGGWPPWESQILKLSSSRVPLAAPSFYPRFSFYPRRYVNDGKLSAAFFARASLLGRGDPGACRRGPPRAERARGLGRPHEDRRGLRAHASGRADAGTGRTGALRARELGGRGSGRRGPGSRDAGAEPPGAVPGPRVHDRLGHQGGVGRGDVPGGPLPARRRVFRALGRARPRPVARGPRRKILPRGVSPLGRRRADPARTGTGGAGPLGLGERGQGGYPEVRLRPAEPLRLQSLQRARAPADRPLQVPQHRPALRPKGARPGGGPAAPDRTSTSF